MCFLKRDRKGVTGDGGWWGKILGRKNSNQKSNGWEKSNSNKGNTLIVEQHQAANLYRILE